MHPPWPRPPSSSMIWAPPPPLAHPSPPSRTCRTTPIRLEVHMRVAGFKVAGAAKSQHRLGSSQWAKWLSTGPLPRLWYGSGGGGADAEGRWKPWPSLFQVRKKLSELSDVSPKSELGFLCAFDSGVHQEFWILSFPKGVSSVVQRCWHHCLLTVKLGIRGQWSSWFSGCQIGSGEQRQALEDKQRKKVVTPQVFNYRH
jgi:hypothetical protein